MRAIDCANGSFRDRCRYIEYEVKYACFACALEPHALYTHVPPMFPHCFCLGADRRVLEESWSPLPGKGLGRLPRGRVQARRAELHRLGGQTALRRWRVVRVD